MERAAALLIRETIRAENRRVEVVLAGSLVRQDEGIGDMDVVYVEGILHVQGLLCETFLSTLIIPEKRRSVNQ